MTDREAVPNRGLGPGQACALWGVVAAGWAIFLLPLVCGPVGMALGGIAYWRGERRGRWVALAALVGMLLGIVLGVLPDKFVST